MKELTVIRAWNIRVGMVGAGKEISLVERWPDSMFEMHFGYQYSRDPL